MRPLRRKRIALLPSLAVHLQSGPKGDKEKVTLTARRRRETALSLEWLADRLAMGGWTGVSNLPTGRRHSKRRPKPRKLSKVRPVYVLLHHGPPSNSILSLPLAFIIFYVKNNPGQSRSPCQRERFVQSQKPSESIRATIRRLGAVWLGFQVGSRAGSSPRNRFHFLFVFPVIPETLKRHHYEKSN
jgi:hypothetical protein